MTFYLQQKQGGIGNPYIITAAKDLAKLGEYLKDGQTTYAVSYTHLHCSVFLCTKHESQVSG